MQKLSATVVIPTYNYAQFLGDAISSALEQGDAVSRIIVIDDGSTDSTPELIRQYPSVCYVRQANAGLATSRNNGLQLVETEYVVFLDSDDRLSQGSVARNIRAIQNTGFKAVSGTYELIDEVGRPMRAPVSENNLLKSFSGQTLRYGYSDLLKENLIGVPCSVLYVTEEIRRLGGFNSAYNPCEDLFLYFQLARENKLGFHPDLVAEYRKHGNSMSDNTKGMHKGVVKVYGEQRPFISSDETLKLAHDEGIDQWNTMYGPRMVAKCVNYARSLKLPEAMAELQYILGYSPKLFMVSGLELFRRQFRKISSRVKGVLAP